MIVYFSTQQTVIECCIHIATTQYQRHTASAYTDLSNHSNEAIMFTWIKRFIITASFLALITTNILTLTSTAFNAALSGLMGTYLGVRTVTGATRQCHTGRCV